MKAEAFAPAKINLTLHVTGRRPDGYHLLDSLVAFADAGDRLRLSSGSTLKLEVSGPFSEGVPADRRNLVWRAAEGVGWTGLIRLEKNLPHGAGIGGGSSDAAALLAAAKAQGHAVPDGLALSLGADVPVCMAAQASRMAGIGEKVTPAALPDLPAVLVNPGVIVPTPQVFKALSCRENPPMAARLPELSSPQAAALWLADQRNDLEAPAMACQPVIGEVLSQLSELPGCLLTRMSGSGATCFALFDTSSQAAAASDLIAASRPGWWVQAVTLS
jgi:4-diphosphocytidyl-2-C-methyl-D-erythritol kinase